MMFSSSGICQQSSDLSGLIMQTLDILIQFKSHNNWRNNLVKHTALSVPGQDSNPCYFILQILPKNNILSNLPPWCLKFFLNNKQINLYIYIYIIILKADVFDTIFYCLLCHKYFYVYLELQSHVDMTGQGQR